MPTLGKKVAAEFMGTLILVFFGGMAVILTANSPLGLNSYADLLAVGLAFGLALAAAIHAYGKLSGGHFNPAVTTAMLATGRIPVAEALAYYAAQIGGAVAAALIQAIIFDFARNAVFITAPGNGASFTAATVAEVMGTFLLVSVIFGVAVDGRAPAGWAPWMIGMAIPAGALAVGPISGASFNPAVSLGPRIVAALSGADARWGDLLIYIIGPVVGALIAALLYELIAEPRNVQEPLERAMRAEPTVGKK